jgi:tetratricopeptide (TPR) repeat protein
MFITSRYTRLIALLALSLSLLLSQLPARVAGGTQSPTQSSPTAVALSLIYRQKYNDAITRLEETLEREPDNGEAQTLMATANFYQSLDFAKAQKDFDEAYKAGGGATFFVSHSHELVNSDDIVDYCRGWLHLRRDSLEYVPIDSNHGFKVTFAQVEEFKRNRLTKRLFHIKFDGKSQNFRGRSNTETEALLIVALYNRFTRN